MNRILLFASQPLYSQVLPGLSPPLLPYQSALLYQALLRDQLRILSQLQGARVCICFAPGLLPGSFVGDYDWEIQKGATPQERLSAAFQGAFKAGASKALALGFEDRLLPQAVLEEALQALDSASVVLGEGLVGFKRYLPSMLKVQPHQFRGMAVAFSLKYRMLKGSLAFEKLDVLERELRMNPAQAPLCAMTLRSMA